MYQSDDEAIMSGAEILEQSSDSGGEGQGSDSEGVLLESDAEPEPKESSPKRRKYANRNPCGQQTFLGRAVCVRAHQRLYGIGSTALQNIRRNMPAYTMNDKRLPEPKHDVLKVSTVRSSENMQWPHIVKFFWLLYISAAEVLPTKLVMPEAWGIDKMERDPDFCERFTTGFLQNLEKHFDLSHPGQIGPGTFQGPRRYLEHARAIDLYMQYTAHSDAENVRPASLSTFMRAYKKYSVLT